MRFETRLVNYNAAPGDPYHPSATPIYQTSTFRQCAAGAAGEYDYTRSGNPTRRVLEKQLAQTEGGTRALAFNSGMAAITEVTSLLSSGDEMLAGDDLLEDLLEDLAQALAACGLQRAAAKRGLRSLGRLKRTPAPSAGRKES